MFDVKRTTLPTVSRRSPSIASTSIIGIEVADELRRRHCRVYHGVGYSAATSVTSLTLYNDVRHCRISERILAVFILGYYRTCP